MWVIGDRWRSRLCVGPLAIERTRSQVPYCSGGVVGGALGIWADLAAIGCSERKLDPMSSRSIIPSDLQGYHDDWRMSPGVISNGLLFLTGMTGHRPDGTFAADPEEQFSSAFAKIDSVLSEAGLGRSALIEMTSYHVGLQDHVDVFRSERDKFVVEPYPAWTAIEVAGFITPGAIVEIRAVATTTAP